MAPASSRKDALPGPEIHPHHDGRGDRSPPSVIDRSPRDQGKVPYLRAVEVAILDPPAVRARGRDRPAPPPAARRLPVYPAFENAMRSRCPASCWPGFAKDRARPPRPLLRQRGAGRILAWGDDRRIRFAHAPYFAISMRRAHPGAGPPDPGHKRRGTRRRRRPGRSWPPRRNRKRRPRSDRTAPAGRDRPRRTRLSSP